MAKTVYTRIQTKRDSSTNWEQNNPILLDGEEILVDTSNGEVRRKIGDGTTSYNNLPFTDEIKIQQFIDIIYPIGAVYISVNSTNPTLLFGGTWVQLENQFLLAAGSQYTAGSTGGSVNHKLTAAELPDHTHLLGTQKDTGNYTLPLWGLRFSPDSYTVVNKAEDIPTTAACGVTGSLSNVSNNAFSIMPPYLAVYMWKRIS